MIPLGVLAGSRHVSAVGAPAVLLGGSASSGADQLTYTWDIPIGPGFPGRHLLAAAVVNRGNNTGAVTFELSGATPSTITQGTGWRRCAIADPVPMPTGETVQLTLFHPAVQLTQAAACVWILPSAPSVVDHRSALSGSFTLGTMPGGHVLGVAYGVGSMAGATLDWTQTVESMTAIGYRATTTGADVTLNSANSFSAISLAF